MSHAPGRRFRGRWGGGLVVGVLSVHPGSVAATRLRALQYAPAVAARGGVVRHWSFLREQDLRAWFGPGQLARALVLLRCLLRVPWALQLVWQSHVVVVQREALPLGPPVLEAFAWLLRPVVWDVDDALWAEFTSPTAGRVPQWLRASGDKYRRVCHHAAEVWAGSEVLAAWCRQHNPATVVVPTVVDVPAQRPSTTTRDSIIWIGSHSTGPFLQAVLPALSELQRPVEVVAVGGGRLDPPVGVALQARDWSLAVEREVLGRGRVGLYPIDVDHPLADGKCGLKAILYMAHGIPPVVTPTPTNAAVVRGGVDGIYARNEREWTSAVEALLEDDALWDAMSRASHARALGEYSLVRWAPWWAERLHALAKAGA